MRRAPHSMRQAPQAAEKIGGAEEDRTPDLRIANAIQKTAEGTEQSHKIPEVGARRRSAFFWVWPPSNAFGLSDDYIRCRLPPRPSPVGSGV